MFRRPVVVRRGPGLVGTVARTAVVAGTATVVSRGVSNAMTSGQRQQAAVQQAQMEAQQADANAVAMQAQMDAQAQQMAAQQQAQMQAQLEAQQAQIAQQQAQLAAAQQPAAQPAYAAPPTQDTISQLKDLAQLRDAGVLTDEEFQREKARILGQ